MRYAHTNIVATDWKRFGGILYPGLRVYRQTPRAKSVGGLARQRHRVDQCAAAGDPFGPAGSRGRRPYPGMFTYEAMEQRAPLMANHLGFTHIAFEVDNFAETYAKALSMGATALGQPRKKPSRG
jgi:catechol 2,3-dioxygenase-like lactoylglutathione lyase family enzyme